MSNFAVRIAIDLEIFSLLAAQSGPVSSCSIAAATRSDPTLVYRLLRACGSINFVQQSSSDDAWSANAVTRAMAGRSMAAWHRMFWDLQVRAATHGPQALREGYQTYAVGGFLPRAFGTAATLDLYGTLQTMPALHNDFNEAMGLGVGPPEPWFRSFAVEKELFAGLDDDNASTSAPLLVDVAGGKGHDIQAFHEAFPGRGQLVLQDKAQVIGSIGPAALDSSIVVQKHDFFTRQPVRGARAYFLRRTLHNWPDSHCVRILTELRSAMRPGYSKLLIHEAILPDSGATRTQCEFDMVMMAVNGGLERSKSQWTALLMEAGFEVVKFWGKYADSEGIIEAVVSPP